jgi:hypothetical protein
VSAVRTTDPADSGYPLGKPIKPEPEPAPEPQWKPLAGNPGYESNGIEVRRISDPV